MTDLLYAARLIDRNIVQRTDQNIVYYAWAELVGSKIWESPTHLKRNLAQILSDEQVLGIGALSMFPHTAHFFQVSSRKQSNFLPSLNFAFNKKDNWFRKIGTGVLALCRADLEVARLESQVWAEAHSVEQYLNGVSSNNLRNKELPIGTIFNYQQIKEL